MFIDIAKIKIRAGTAATVPFPFGGRNMLRPAVPTEGTAERAETSFLSPTTTFRPLRIFAIKENTSPENGQPGGGKRCFGKNGADLIIRVPRGTLVKDARKRTALADVSDNTPAVVARGGRGGWGNSHFATPTRQAPRFAKSGVVGEEKEVQLELKLLADVGLIGFPNVGKSTLVSVVSEARPKIANYHFTTLSPVLGVVRIAEGSSFVMADIPGLIEGAGEGVGLGHEFLRHVERCRMLLHIVDVSGSEGRDPCEDFDAINRELAVFSEDLAKRPQIVAGNKCDLASPEQIERFRNYVEQKGYEFFELTAPICEGTKEIINKIAAMLSSLPPVARFEPDPEPETEITRNKFEITKDGEVYVVDAPWLEKIMSTINPDDYESLQYFERVLRESGIIDELKKMGVEDGDTVSIHGMEFDFVT